MKSINTLKNFLIFLALAMAPQAIKASALEQMLIDAPLAHPVAFCVPMLTNTPTCAALYLLKYKQSTISPLWAYAALPVIAMGKFLLTNRTEKEKKLSPGTALIAGACAGALVTVLITSMGLLTIKLCC